MSFARTLIVDWQKTIVSFVQGLCKKNGKILIYLVIEVKGVCR